MTARAAGIIIAIDGPAGSGKSSTAKAVARELGYRHLDSGAFYRAITLAALRRGIPAERWGGLTRQQLDDLEVDSVRGERGFLLRVSGENVGDQIRSREVNAHVSTMAAVPAVRDWLLDALRDAGRDGGLVADGRDIGTVVFPDAELKIFLVADPRERARRRLIEQGITEPFADEIEGEADRLGARDRQDSTRATAPLREADDAVRVDTTALTFEQQVRHVIELAQSRMTEPAD